MSKSKNWSKLAGYCSAQGIAYVADNTEAELSKIIRTAGHELPSLPEAVKKPGPKPKVKKLNDK